MKRLLVIALTAALSLAAPAASEAAKKRSIRLKAFGSCKSLVSYGTRHLDRVGGPMARPQPVQGGGGAGGMDEAAAAPAPAAAPDASTTNVQEAGIDEPDIVKSDGSTIFALSAGKLHAVDARAEQPVRLDTIEIRGASGDAQLLVHEGKALVVHSVWRAYDAPQGRAASASMPAYGESQTVLTELDVRDPRALRVLRTYTADGNLVSARLTGGTARLVLTAMPRARYDESGARRVSRWLPKGTLRNRRTGRSRRHNLVGCRSVRRPAQFSGLDTLTVLTVDVAKGLPAVDADGLLTDAETVYASADSLYVATQRWVRALERPTGGQPTVPDGLTTVIHRFDTARAGETTYRASGEVPGFLLSQWSLSEHRGVLRVASTDQPAWWGGGSRQSESFVTTLAQRDGALRKLGSVGGLGKGERIYAVRFIEDIGYVVTFRQTDPLYTVDVGDPSDPKVLGELKIPGYSAYLHPVGPGRLLGIGQDADERGRPLGAQVSLFDVSDLRNPRRIARHDLGAGSWTEVENDHRSFLWWAASDLAVLPLDDPERDRFRGAAALTVTRDAITERPRIAHPGSTGWKGRIQRSMVVGDRLYTLSAAGLKASRLGDLSDAGWVELE